MSAPGADARKVRGDAGDAAATHYLDARARKVSRGAERLVIREARRPRLTIKEDELFLCTDLLGEVPGRAVGELGLYYRDTRYLSRLELRFGGRPLALLAWTAERGYSAVWEYTNMEFRGGGGEIVPQSAIHVRRTCFLAGRLHERLRIRNYSDRAFNLPVEVSFGADYLDIFEVRAARRRHGRAMPPPVLHDRVLTFTYEGADGVRRATSIAFDRQPEAVEDGRVRFTIKLAPRSRSFLRFTVAAIASDTPAVGEEGSDRRLGAVGRAHQRWAAESTEIFTDNEQFTALLHRGQQDLAMLLVDTPWGRIPMAGVPWFAAPFGRAIALSGLQTLMLDQRIAVAGVRALTRLQAQESDAARAAEPGKIMHEMRRGELAALGRIPHTPSYFSIDATPLYLHLIAETVMWSGDLEFFELLREPILAALRWIDECGDRDGDGFIEYSAHVGDRQVHQGWRDAHEAIVHPDGTPADGPIALAEVQAYVYQAKRRLAQLFGQLGDVDRSEQLQAEAERLRRRFNEQFWMPDEQYVAMALDGRKRQVKTIVSTAGHCLYARILDDRLVPPVVQRLVSSDLFSGWGVRSMSGAERAYNPVSFYNGGVWPADTAIIAYGFKKLGFAQEANLLIGSMVETARFYNDLRLPELLCGFTRRSTSRPVAFPMASSPSATSAGAVFLMVQAMLGLFPAAEDNILYIHNPTLPKWLTDVRVRGLKIGRSTVSLRFYRQGNQTVLAVRDKQGPVRVVVVE